VGLGEEKSTAYCDHSLRGVDESQLSTGVLWAGDAAPDSCHQGRDLLSHRLAVVDELLLRCFIPTHTHTHIHAELVTLNLLRYFTAYTSTHYKRTTTPIGCQQNQ